MVHIKCDFFFHHCMASLKIPDGLCNLQTRVILRHVTKCHSGFRNWRALLNTIIIFRVYKIAGNFLSSYATMRISRRDAFCGVNYILTVVILLSIFILTVVILLSIFILTVVILLSIFILTVVILFSIQQNLQIISYLRLTNWHNGRLVPFLHTVRPQVERDL